MPVIESSISAVLRERAHLAPSATAFTFMNYDQDSAGIAESLTWSQVYRRALGVAQEPVSYTHLTLPTILRV